MTSSDVSVLASLFLLRSLTLLLLVCLLLCSSLRLLFSEFAAFSGRSPSHGEDGHTPLGFLHITLVPQTEGASLFPQ